MPNRVLSTRLRRRVVSFGALALAAALTVTGCAGSSEPASLEPEATIVSPPAPVDKEKSFFDAGKYSIDDPDSIWVVNNKIRPLNPIDYAPGDLVRVNLPGGSLIRQVAATAMEQMAAAALAEGAGQLGLNNAYRSYSTQLSLHQSWIDRIGKAAAQAQSARAGHSEHQTGLTADMISVPQVCSIQQCFATTPQGKWLKENAWRFGYIIRYPEGKTAITGYIYEPWHVRYVGEELAAEMHRQGVETMEEFFNLPAAPDYID